MALLLGGSFNTAGCTGPLSTLEPAGPAAQAVSTLWWIMLLGASAILILVLGLLAMAFVTPARHTRARLWLVGGGVVFPGVVLAGLLAVGLVLGEQMIPHRGAEQVEVVAEAAQFRWRFSYPGTALAPTDNVLHIPAGQPVVVNLSTKDVIHSFWVPQLAGKMDAIPGRTNRLSIEAFTPGTYQGICAEYCGVGHSRHGFEVVAHTPENWQAMTGGSPP